MGKTVVDKAPKSWGALNRTRREEKRKWKEENLAKKLEKQKRKLELEAAIKEQQKQQNEIKEISTLSIAVAGSIMENAQSPELRAYLAGQIARAACIFQVDEIVIFDDYSDEANCRKETLDDNYGTKTIRRCCVQLGRMLQYLECPQYLRKSFFPIHKDLQFCGILNPLNAPHHLTKDEHFMFREGVVSKKPVKEGKGSIVDVGLYKDVHIDKRLTPGLRCTVHLLTDKETPKKCSGTIVPASRPRQETGIYWGYNIRLANSLSQVFSQSPYPDGYDLTIGTSDKGTSVDQFECPTYKHLLIVFGGLHGLEMALETDTILTTDDPQLLFDHYLNTVPQQGSKTVRTEEAILISLAALRPKLQPENKVKEFDPNLIITKPINNETIHKQKTRIVENRAKDDDLSRFD